MAGKMTLCYLGITLMLIELKRVDAQEAVCPDPLKYVSNQTLNIRCLNDRNQNPDPPCFKEGCLNSDELCCLQKCFGVFDHYLCLAPDPEGALTDDASDCLDRIKDLVDPDTCSATDALSQFRVGCGYNNASGGANSDCSKTCYDATTGGIPEEDIIFATSCDTDEASDCFDRIEIMIDYESCNIADALATFRSECDVVKANSDCGKTCYEVQNDIITEETFTLFGTNCDTDEASDCFDRINSTINYDSCTTDVTGVLNTFFSGCTSDGANADCGKTCYEVDTGEISEEDFIFPNCDADTATDCLDRITNLAGENCDIDSTEALNAFLSDCDAGSNSDCGKTCRDVSKGIITEDDLTFVKSCCCRTYEICTSKPRRSEEYCRRRKNKCMNRPERFCRKRGLKWVVRLFKRLRWNCHKNRPKRNHHWSRGD